MILRIFILISILLIQLDLFAQKKRKAISMSSVNKMNFTDSKGLRQGFWILPLPETMKHKVNYQEGLYYNNKMVGVWYKRHGDRQAYEMRIFYDTSEYVVEHFAYHENSQVGEHGFYYYCPLGYNDTINYSDATTKQKKQLILECGHLKQGKWTYYHPNGQIHSEGSYKAHEKNGVWKYYDEKGNLLKEEEY